MNDIQNILDDLNSNNISIEEIKKCLNSKNILIKSNAILALVRLRIVDTEIINQLSKIATNINNESRVIGVWNNGHFALAALKLLGTKESLVMYKELLYKVDTSQKGDVERLLGEWPN